MLRQAEVGSYYGGIVCVGMQLDLTTLTAIQWLVPAILCTTGFVLIISLWRVRQRKRRRARKGSSRSLSNL
jgi:membrane-bound transcription factor site-1 protease